MDNFTSLLVAVNQTAVASIVGLNQPIVQPSTDHHSHHSSHSHLDTPHHFHSPKSPAVTSRHQNLTSTNLTDESNGSRVTSAAMVNDHHDSMMSNYFHISLGDTLLFKGCKLETESDVAIAFLIFFSLAILYEGLKSLRETLFQREARSGAYRLSLYNPTNGCPDDLVPAPGNLSASLNQSEEVTRTAMVKCTMWSRIHLYQSILHAIQVILSYTLMLGFMTFNSWICLSIITGAGLGYFLFCWRKLSFVNVTDHCN